MARITKLNLAKKTTLPNLPDSNSLSRCRARRPQVIAAAPFLQPLPTVARVPKPTSQL